MKHIFDSEFRVPPELKVKVLKLEQLKKASST